MKWTRTAPTWSSSLSRVQYDDMDPAYIDDNHIVFGSTRNRVLDEYERRNVPQLFVGERGSDGFLINDPPDHLQPEP